MNLTDANGIEIRQGDHLIEQGDGPLVFEVTGTWFEAQVADADSTVSLRCESENLNIDLTQAQVIDNELIKVEVQSVSAESTALFYDEAEAAAPVEVGQVYRVKAAFSRIAMSIEVESVVSWDADSEHGAFLIIKGRRIRAAFDRPKQFPDGYLIYGNSKVYSIRVGGRHAAEFVRTDDHRGIQINQPAAG